MKAIKVIAIIFLNLVSFISYSQDLIIKQDNSTIYCKITDVDSLSVYYKQNKKGQPVDMSIKRIDVLKCYSSTSRFMFENKSNKPVISVPSAKDSSQTKIDSVQQISHAISWRDSIKVIKEPVIAKNDSLFFKDKMFMYQKKIIFRTEVFDLMEGNKEACEEMESALSTQRISRLVAGGSGALIGAGLANLIFEKPGAGAEVGIGIGIALLCIPIQQAAYKHIRKAIKLYNSKLRMASVTNPKLQFGMASRGIGFCIRF